MRLWHKDLIQVLPRQQLISQWRECCCIAKNIKENGMPNHILVNKIMDYQIKHFIAYTFIVRKEMINRGYKCNGMKFTKYFDEWDDFKIYPCEIFEYWHTERYLKQCLYNLQEKYDCGGISDSEWRLILDKYKSIL